MHHGLIASIFKPRSLHITFPKRFFASASVIPGEKSLFLIRKEYLINKMLKENKKKSYLSEDRPRNVSKTGARPKNAK